MDSHNLDDVATHAINALPREEADELEASLDDRMAAQLASYERVAIALTEGLPDIVPAASPDLWDRISEEVGITPRPDQSRWIHQPFLMLAAAAIVAVVAVGATVMLASRDRADDARSLAATAAAAETSMAVTLTSPDGIAAIQAEVVIAADGIGYIVADSLPRLTEDRTYQLWLIIDDRVVSAAILGNEPHVNQFRAEGNITGIAVSNEQAGGVVVSEVPPTALWLSDTI
jgi:hypothetical protein